MMVFTVHKRKSKVAQNEKKKNYLGFHISIYIVQQIWKHFAGTFCYVECKVLNSEAKEWKYKCSHILGKFLTYWYLYAFIKIIIQ